MRAALGKAASALAMARWMPTALVKRADDAGELDQQPVAERFDHAPAILRRQRLDDRLPVLPVAGDRAGLVGFHVAGIADHVDGQDGS